MTVAAGIREGQALPLRRCLEASAKLRSFYTLRFPELFARVRSHNSDRCGRKNLSLRLAFGDPPPSSEGGKGMRRLRREADEERSHLPFRLKQEDKRFRDGQATPLRVERSAEGQKNGADSAAPGNIVCNDQVFFSKRWPQRGQWMEIFPFPRGTRTVRPQPGQMK